MNVRPIIFSAPMVLALLNGQKTQTRRTLSHVLDGSEARRCHSTGRTWDVWTAGNPGQLHGAVDTAFVEGDVLWVRETCRGEELADGQDGVRYRADDAFQPIGNNVAASIDWLNLHTYRGHQGAPVGPWVPPIHTPRWTSRLTLVVTDVRVQRLQDISEAEAIAEGIYRVDPTPEDIADGCTADDFVFHAPGVPNGIGMTREQRQRDNWWPNACGAFRLLWNHIHGPGAWEANPWVAAYTFTVHRQNVDAYLATSAAA